MMNSNTSLKTCNIAKTILFAKELPDGSIQVSKDNSHINVLTIFPSSCKMKPNFHEKTCLINHFEHFLQW